MSNPSRSRLPIWSQPPQVATPAPGPVPPRPLIVSAEPPWLGGGVVISSHAIVLAVLATPTPPASVARAEAPPPHPGGVYSAHAFPSVTPQVAPGVAVLAVEPSRPRPEEGRSFWTHAAVFVAGVPVPTRAALVSAEAPPPYQGSAYSAHAVQSVAPTVLPAGVCVMAVEPSRAMPYPGLVMCYVAMPTLPASFIPCPYRPVTVEIASNTLARVEVGDSQLARQDPPGDGTLPRPDECR